jgi:rhamnosyltransferase
MAYERPGIMSKSSDKYISVFVPTFNGEKYLAELIEAVLGQELPIGYKLELLIIDSGSKDHTVEIVKAYGDKLMFEEIPNSEFGHGKTRQHAAEVTKGEFILYLSQDATPSHHRWLINMIEPFFVSDKVGCVFGRQIPRTDAIATIKHEVLTAFGGIGAPDSIIIHRNKSLVDGHETNNLNTFFSDVNSAVRRELLIGSVPFRDVQYAEDQALAEDMQKAEYLKAYSPQGSVWHSNEYSVTDFKKRKFDEFIGLQESVNYVMSPSYKSLILGWIRPTINDVKFIMRDKEYSKKHKIKNLVLAAPYNIAHQSGKFLASKYSSNETFRNRHSLESREREKPTDDHGRA